MKRVSDNEAQIEYERKERELKQIIQDTATRSRTSLPPAPIDENLQEYLQLKQLKEQQLFLDPHLHL